MLFSIQRDIRTMYEMRWQYDRRNQTDAKSSVINAEADYERQWCNVCVCYYKTDINNSNLTELNRGLV